MTTYAAAIGEMAELPAPDERLSWMDESFYRFLWKRMLKQGGVCTDTNAKLAQWQKKYPSTITRRVARLEAKGWIMVEQLPGVERQIYPLVQPPDKDTPRPPSAWERIKERLAQARAERASRAHGGEGFAPSVESDPAARADPEAPPKGKLSEGDAQGDAEGTPRVGPSVPLCSIVRTQNNIVPPASVTVDPAGGTAVAIAADDPDVVALIAAGFDADRAPGFVTLVGREAVREAIAVVDYYSSVGQAKNRPGGYIYTFATNYKAGKYELPDGLAARREEERRAREQAEQRAREREVVISAVEATGQRLSDQEAAREADQAAALQRREAERWKDSPPELHAPWQAALEYLAGLIPTGRIKKPAFEMHLRPLVPLQHVSEPPGGAPGIVTLGAPSAFTREWVEHRLDVLREALTHALAAPVQVRLVVQGSGGASGSAGKTRRQGRRM